MTDTDTPETPATEEGATKEELRARIEELEAEVESLEEQLEEGAFAPYTDAELEQARALVPEMRDAVVTISATEFVGGTAWFNEDGKLITNAHVVGENEEMTCWTLGGTEFTGKVLGKTDNNSRPYNDIAVVEPDIEPPNTLSLVESTSLSQDQALLQIGHPSFVGNWVPTIGQYKGDTFGDKMRTTIAGRGGVSGSPVISLDGDVVGLTTGAVPREQTAGGRPEPVSPEIKAEFEDFQWSTHEYASTVHEFATRFA